ncbi:MAG TPA: YlxR family protein [Firmicutes bacterium]|nr:YlxR family protein [Bacillota bacterium]
MPAKKIPLRMCTGCNQMKPKKEMVRVVKSPEGEISIDLTGKKSGRGAYVCRNIECLQKARKSRRFEKSFSQKIPDAVYDQMEADLREGAL